MANDLLDRRNRRGILAGSLYRVLHGKRLQQNLSVIVDCDRLFTRTQCRVAFAYSAWNGKSLCRNSGGIDAWRIIPLVREFGNSVCRQCDLFHLKFFPRSTTFWRFKYFAEVYSI